MFSHRSRIAKLFIGLFLVASTTAISSVGFASVLQECDMPNGTNCWHSDTNPDHEINTLSHFGLPDPFNTSASNYVISAKATGGKSSGRHIVLWKGATGEIWQRLYFFFPSAYDVNSGCSNRGLKFLESRTTPNIAGGFIKLDGNQGNYQFGFQTQFTGCQGTIATVGPGWHYMEVHFKVNAGANDLVEVWLDADAITDPPTWSATDDWWSDGDQFWNAVYNVNWSGGTAPKTQEYYIKGAVASTTFIGDTFGLLGPPPPSDTTPPSIPTNLSATVVSSSQINLSWSPSSDPESGISNYNIYRDNVLVGTSNTTSFSVTGLSEGTTYTYEVSAVSGAGLESSQSSSISATTSIDTTPPTITSVTATGDPTKVQVAFREPIEQTSATNVGNYSINNAITVSGASLGFDLKTVTLTTSSHSEGITHTLTLNNVLDRATVPNAIAANTQVTYTFVPQLIISNLNVASGRVYEVVQDGLQVGALVYTDRSFTYSSIPASLEGATYIKTANDDKASSGSSFLSFDVNQDVTVYVAHDNRFTTKPSWMASFADTGADIVTTDKPFSLFKKDFVAGTITLGGNTADGSGNKSMYSVVITAQALTPTPPPPPPISEAACNASGVLFCDSFESGDYSAWDPDPYGSSNPINSTSFVTTMADAPHGQSVRVYHLNQGETGGGGNSVATNITASKKVHYRFYIKYDPNWVFEKFQKAAQMWAGSFTSPNNTDLAVYIQPNFVTGGDTREFIIVHYRGSSGVNDVILKQNIGTPVQMVKDRWYAVEVMVLINDSGISNGIARMWIDGGLKLEYTNQRFTDKDISIHIVGHNSYMNDGAPGDQDVYYDAFVVSRDSIGIIATDPPSDEPPVPPTGLVVTAP